MRSKKRKEEGLNKFIKIQYIIQYYVIYFFWDLHSFSIAFYTNYLIRLKDTHHRVNFKKMSKNYCEQKSKRIKTISRAKGKLNTDTGMNLKTVELYRFQYLFF